MKRYILNILLFFALAWAIDSGVGIFGDYLQANAKGGETRILNDLVCKDTHDIVILGSSRAHHHYDTPFLSDTLGLDVYNAGYDGNGVILAYGLLEMILERYQPKLLIYDVEPDFDINVYQPDNNHKRYLAQLKPYFRHSGAGEVIKDVSSEEWYKVHSGMMRYNTSILSMTADYFRAYNPQLKGYAPHRGIYDKEPTKNKKKDVQRDSFKLDYMARLLTLAQDHRIPIIVVASPKYGMTSSDALQPVKEICANKEVPFIDYYSDAEFMHHKEWFKEPMHLNADGARVFSKRIIDRISESIRY